MGTFARTGNRRQQLVLALATTLALGWHAGTQATTYAYEHIANGARGQLISADGQLVAGVRGSDFAPTIWRDGTAYAVGNGNDFYRWLGISASGWVLANTADLSNVYGAPAIWAWNAGSGSFARTDIGAFPDLQDTIGAGIDDQNNVFGYATNRERPADKIFRPYIWTMATGFTELTSFGHPDYPELPIAVSPGGVIATPNLSYQFGVPGSEVAVTPPPSPYTADNSATQFVNDAGMRAGFLRTVDAGVTFRHLARYSPDTSAWQVIAGPSGPSILWDTGSLDAQGTLTATVNDPAPGFPEIGVRAEGPDGVAADVAPQISAAYAGLIHVDGLNGETGSGALLADLTLGDASVMGKLVPVEACTADCLVATLELSVKVVDRNGSCTGLKNRSRVRVSVSDETGAPVAGAAVSVALIDRAETLLEGVTNARGRATLRSSGPGCNGRVNAFVTGVTLPGASLDRTAGTLAASVLP
ncbi:carboxypeptidase regulatory-like domain-containing protein [Mangrovimicrobium sediminis]|uniref:Carboxypeptidase regulatory-like domain-containing protein n=1 Tax=Mangrovimicrobium sediminis TaxID=2562682 RepID=A0A4Z0M5F4_9GAMM|nr:carboxypeptidase-like regulatory domain-containing protein [Haliea sp. SAOS-164]TGD74650.1 carboxypeptidase regulatory-like domain-containing protein [Haliea sp. SAOS-164]